MNAPNDKLDEIIRVVPGMKSPTVLPLALEGWSSLHSVVEPGESWIYFAGGRSATRAVGTVDAGLVTAGGSSGAWSDSLGSQSKETLTFLDDDIARFMEEASARRGQQPLPPIHQAGYYETAFRVLGRYMDEQKPRDVFFFEQGGAFVVRLLMTGAAGSHHELSEFTKDDIDQLVAQGPALRYVEPTKEATR